MDTEKNVLKLLFLVKWPDHDINVITMCLVIKTIKVMWIIEIWKKNC